MLAYNQDTEYFQIYQANENDYDTCCTESKDERNNRTQYSIYVNNSYDLYYFRINLNLIESIVKLFNKFNSYIINTVFTTEFINSSIVKYNYVNYSNYSDINSQPVFKFNILKIDEKYNEVKEILEEITLEKTLATIIFEYKKKMDYLEVYNYIWELLKISSEDVLGNANFSNEMNVDCFDKFFNCGSINSLYSIKRIFKDDFIEFILLNKCQGFKDNGILLKSFFKTYYNCSSSLSDLVKDAKYLNIKNRRTIEERESDNIEYRRLYKVKNESLL